MRHCHLYKAQLYSFKYFNKVCNLHVENNTGESTITEHSTSKRQEDLCTQNSLLSEINYLARYWREKTNLFLKEGKAFTMERWYATHYQIIKRYSSDCISSFCYKKDIVIVFVIKSISYFLAFYTTLLNKCDRYINIS